LAGWGVILDRHKIKLELQAEFHVYKCTYKNLHVRNTAVKMKTAEFALSFGNAGGERGF